MVGAYIHHVLLRLLLLLTTGARNRANVPSIIWPLTKLRFENGSSTTVSANVVSGSSGELYDNQAKMAGKLRCMAPVKSFVGNDVRISLIAICIVCILVISDSNGTLVYHGGCKL